MNTPAIKHQTLKQFCETIPTEVMSRLREAVQPEGKKALWLKQLDDDQLAEVYHRLCIQKQPILHVARVVKKQFGIHSEWKPFQFSDGLKKFRERVSTEIENLGYKGEQEAAEAKSLSKTGQKLSKKVDGLGRLGWLIEVQSERVEMFFEHEKKLRMPLKKMNETVKVLGDLINIFMTQGRKTGAIEQVPSEINWNIKHGFDQLKRNVIKGDTNKMLMATQKMLEYAEEECLILRHNEETGTFEVIEGACNGDKGSESDNS